MRNVVLSGFVLALASMSFSQANFRPRPGVMEFTGEMIVRPKQMKELARSGLSLTEIRRSDSEARARLSSRTKEYFKSVDEYVVRVPAGSNENKFANELLATGQYQYVQPNWRCFPVAIPNDTRFNEQWHLRTIQAPSAWDLWTGSNSFITAYVDTGILRTHPDLKDIRIPGYNSVDRLTEAAGGNVDDINGHGTHVSGCGSAHGNNGIGVSGVGWNFKVMHVKTSNAPSGGASSADILAGARWAAENGAKTVSASYAGVDNPANETTGAYIAGLGAQFFYAAGNDSRDLSGFSYPNTIVVGSSAQGDVRSVFSAYGRGVTLFAPGSGILSTTNNGGYGFASGTSMATPVANGAFALTWSVNPLLDVRDVKSIVFSTCDVIGSPSIFGFGRVNVSRSVSTAMQTLAQEGTIVAADAVTGQYNRGDVASIRDANLGNSYDVISVPVRGVGTVAATSVDYQFPANAVGIVRSFNVDATLDITGSAPASVLVFALNRNTNQYDLITSSGMIPGVNDQVSFRLASGLSNYVSNRTIRLLYRSVVPARLGQVGGAFRIKYSRPRFTFSFN
jgi:hypothetical protein